MELPFKALCINDSERPSDIPTSKWIKRNKMYTVTVVARMMIQGGRLGFKLAEVSLEGCFPYEFYAANRFAIVLDQKLISEIELNELLKEAIEEEKYEEIIRSIPKRARVKKSRVR